VHTFGFNADTAYQDHFAHQMKSKFSIVSNINRIAEKQRLTLQKQHLETRVSHFTLDDRNELLQP